MSFKGFGGPIGGGDASEIQGISVSSTPPTINQVLIYNGNQYVPAAQGTSFSFAVSSFADGNGSPIEIGSGTWKSIGVLSFTASYSNGPATAATVSMAGAGNAWSPNSLAMTNSFDGPTATTQAVNYPASPDTSIVFTLSATGAAGSGTAAISHTFNNDVYWGVDSKASGYTSSDVTGLASNALQSSRNANFSVSPGAGQYIVYAYPSRYGTATFTVGGFAGGFQAPMTVSVTNGSGYTENFYVYLSTNTNLGTTAVTVS